MATLLELFTIEVNSQKDSAVETDPDVLAAIDLRRKVRSAVLQHAKDTLQTALPNDDTRNDALELLAWAQRMVTSPDSNSSIMLRLLLAANAVNTPSQILGASDGTIESALTPILPLLAKGLTVGR